MVVSCLTLSHRERKSGWVRFYLTCSLCSTVLTFHTHSETITKLFLSKHFLFTQVVGLKGSDHRSMPK